MRNFLLFLSFVIVGAVLSSCSDSYTKENLDKMVSVTSTTKELSKYIMDIQAVEIERAEPNKDPYYWYDITGTLDDSFDELSNKDKYLVFAKIVELMQQNGGDIISDGEFFCGEEIRCYIGRIDLSTSNHTFGTEYYPTHPSDLFWMDDEIVYDDSKVDGKYIDPLADHDKEEIIVDSTEETEEDQSSSYSDDFIDYNTKYYEQFRNQMDLIASNFEILAMDGFGNQDIVDDLITWTSEFNGLLDVYETDSIPVNEMDQELHDRTVEMIMEQRLVNENIINGLTEYDETYLLTAGDHLESVTYMYLKGYELLSY